MARKYHLDQTFTHKSATHQSTIYYTRIGEPDAPPLIFIHGTPWSSAVWSSLATTLSSRYSVYLYDHPGFGASPPLQRLTPASDAGTLGPKNPDLDATLELRAAASADFIKSLHLNQAPHIIAHDNAGLVSLRLILQHNLTFSSLCLMDVVTTGAPGIPFFKLVAENFDTLVAIPAIFSQGLGRAYINNASYKGLSKEAEDMLTAPWAEGGTQGPERFLQEMVQAQYRDTGGLENRYSEVCKRVPVKIIWGKQDAWLPVSRGEKLSHAIVAKEFVVVDHAGHLIMYDQPERLVLEVGLWLEACSR